MGKKCSTHRHEIRFQNFCWKALRQETNREDLDINGSVILRYTLGKVRRDCGLDSTGLRYGPVEISCWAHDNTLPGSKKFAELPEKLTSDCKVLKIILLNGTE